jgi:hypothetical protein
MFGSLTHTVHFATSRCGRAKWSIRQADCTASLQRVAARRSLGERRAVVLPNACGESCRVIRSRCHSMIVRRTCLMVRPSCFFDLSVAARAPLQCIARSRLACAKHLLSALHAQLLDRDAQNRYGWLLAAKDDRVEQTLLITKNNRLHVYLRCALITYERVCCFAGCSAASCPGRLTKLHRLVYRGVAMTRRSS